MLKKGINHVLGTVLWSNAHAHNRNHSLKMAEVKLDSYSKSFGGFQKIYEHKSDVTKCSMKFAIYLPPQAEHSKVPVLYWLSGLTCNEQNFIVKSGAQRYAAEHGVIIVAPDTSPRGCKIDGDNESYDFGVGAGFYVDATEEKWKTNYNMYSYVTKELPAVVNANFPVLSDQQGIFGHSMGGHGALICALKNPGMYKSVSALAPICNPINAPLGQKAFTGYLGPDKELWKRYDATELAKSYSGPMFSNYILIDQGKDDEFLATQLLPDNFIQGCQSRKIPVVLRMHEGYDHGYFFVSSFIGDHIKMHAEAFKQSK